MQFFLGLSICLLHHAILQCTCDQISGTHCDNSFTVAENAKITQMSFVKLELPHEKKYYIFLQLTIQKMIQWQVSHQFQKIITSNRYIFTNTLNSNFAIK